jgi:hypothetical protein
MARPVVLSVEDKFRLVVAVMALLTELGTILVNFPPAKANPKRKGRSIGKRVPQEGQVELKVLTRPNRTNKVLQIYQVDGTLSVLWETETGDPIPVQLEATKIIMNENKAPGSCRFRPYVGLKLPADIALQTGKREISVALYRTERDKKRGKRGNLRAAHVRAVGPGNNDFWI